LKTATTLAKNLRMVYTYTIVLYYAQILIFDI